MECSLRQVSQENNPVSRDRLQDHYWGSAEVAADAAEALLPSSFSHDPGPELQQRFLEDFEGRAADTGSMILQLLSR